MQRDVHSKRTVSGIILPSIVFHLYFLMTLIFVFRALSLYRARSGGRFSCPCWNWLFGSVNFVVRGVVASVKHNPC